MASMRDPEPVRPQKPRLPAEEVASLFVLHPEHDRVILGFGCRTQRGTSRAMSRMLVHQAATIVAQTEGFLSLSRDRAEAEPIPDDALIPAGQYYFHANDPAFADYCICGDFDAWVPPANLDALPEPWRTLAKASNQLHVPHPSCDASDFSDWVTMADGYCLLTGSKDCRECQHVVPQEHAYWGALHNIVRRATMSHIPLPIDITRDVDDIRSLITLNPLTRNLMDGGYFAPFPLTTANGSIEFVAYFFSYKATTSGIEYHCRALDIPSRISPYLLYIRFAWTVIEFIVPRGTGAVTRNALPHWSSRNMPSEGSESGGGSDMYDSAMDFWSMARIGCLREEYLKEHPEVSATGDPNTLKLV